MKTEEIQIKQTIKFTGKNLNDVFSLPCVNCIIKLDEKPVVVLSPVFPPERQRFCEIGDTLVEYDNGCWDVERQRK